VDLVEAAVKRPPFLGTYVVLAAAVGLGAYVYLVEWNREATPEKPKEKVLAFDKSKAKELSLQSGPDSVQLVKDKDGWRLTAPQSAAADTGEVEGILTTLSSLETDQVVAASPGNLAEYGLEKPRSTVSVLLEGSGEPLKLVLGEKTPDGGAVYAKLPAQPRVFTLPSYVEGSLAKKPFDLRDRDLLHVKRDEVKTLEITGPQGAYALARDDKGEWAFTAPVKSRAGRWSVDGLLGALENLRMESVAAENAADAKPFGLDTPSRTVTLGLGGGARKTLEIGGPAGDKKHHARVAGTPLVAVVAGAVVDDLAKGMAELRAKRLLDVATSDVEGFETEADGAKRAYAKSTGKDKDGLETTTWKRTAPDAKDLDTTKVQDALFAIGGLEIQEFIDAPAALAGYGLDHALLKVSLRFPGGKPPAWFEVGSKDAAWYARRVDDQSVLKLDPAKAEALVKQFKEL
jgi:hypothetical protein